MVLRIDGTWIKIRHLELWIRLYVGDFGSLWIQTPTLGLAEVTCDFGTQTCPRSSCESERSDLQLLTGSCMATPVLKAMCCDERSLRFMAKYCRILCTTTHVNSPALGLLQWHMFILCLALGKAFIPAQSYPAQYHPYTQILRCGEGESTSTHETAVNRTLYIVSSYWTLKGQLIAFALFTYSSVPKWASVSAAQLPLESVYLISIEFWHSHYTVQIVQIQQCASKSRISTFKELYWESWREKYQIQTAELVMCYSHFVAEDICVGYLSCRDVWENQLLMLCCDTLTVTNSCCLLPIDFQSAFSRVTLDSKGARCR